MSMLDYLVDLIGRLGRWSYGVVFLAATLESAAFLGLLVPGESVVVVVGFLAGQGLFDLDALIVVVALGAVLGDNIGYELGRRLGRPWAARHGSRLGLTEARLRRVDEFFSKHGGKAIFLGRFVGFARALVPFVAGSARLRYIVFMPYNLLGAALWAATFVLLGYFLGQAAEQWVGKAGAVVGGIVLVILAGVWVGLWMVGHEAQIKARWARWQQHPRVVAVAQRFAPQLAWLRERLSPGSYFGLQLTLGVLVFAAAAWIFGGIAEDVVNGDPLTIFDDRVALWFHAHQHPWVTLAMAAVSRVHEWTVLAALTALFLAYLAWQRMGAWFVTVICVFPGGMLLNFLLKFLFHRARPIYSELAAALYTYSFPSGHVMAATLFWGILAVYLVERIEAWRWRVLVILIAVLFVALVALSRVYLGVHYVSDVLAAAAEGVAWLVLCYTAGNTYRQHRGERPLTSADRL